MDEYTNIEQAYDADQLEERIRRLRSRVVSLVRYGVAKAGRDFLNRASAPDHRLIARTIERLQEDRFAGPFDPPLVVDALTNAAHVLSRPPAWSLIIARTCPRCQATDGAPCIEGGSPRSPTESHYERIVAACQELHQPPPHLPRLEVRRFGCPKCGALADELCRGAKGPRSTNHQPRVDHARTATTDLIAGTSPQGAPPGPDPDGTLETIGRSTGQPVLTHPYETGAQACFKCKRQTLVYTWEGWTEWRRQEPPHERPSTIQLRFSREAGHTYWANSCGHCGVTQGDFYLYNRPGGAFYQRGTMDLSDPAVVREVTRAESPVARMLRQIARNPGD